MIELSEHEKEYWEERASEPIRFEPYSKDYCDAYNKEHPMPTQIEIERVMQEYFRSI